MKYIYDNVKFESLVGCTLKKIEVDQDDDYIKFHTTDGRVFCMAHNQDCCESVTIESIVGDVDCLVGTPILMAEEGTSTSKDEVPYQSYTWTFYKLATIKGYVDIRWYGESNGYYSEEVSFGFERA